MGLLRGISIVLVALFCLSSHVKSSSSGDFDFYYLTLMWPASFCYQTKAGCCLPTTGAPELDFFITSLQTYNKTGKAVTNCHKTNFLFNQLGDVTFDLYRYWSTIKCPSSNGRSLWKSAWNTYGVCSGLSEHDYFAEALELRSKIDLLPMFERNGIVPSGNNFYKLEFIKKVIKDNLGVPVAIQCSKNVWDEWQLYQIYICIDKNGSSITSCPTYPKFTCGDEVTFGIITYDMLKLSPSNNMIEMVL